MNDRELTARLVAPITVSHRRVWWRLVIASGLVATLLPLAALYTLLTGIGTWGSDIPVGWGMGIVHFVWWIGIGHAGTFLSAILLVARQRWRSPVHRIAESMTLFAVVQAGLFPLLHLGRAWFFYWTLPYPATYEVWPQFGSALTWDVVAISVYLTVSLAFWYLGLLPDLATRRDRSSGRVATVYAVAAMGWRGSASEWRHHRTAQILLAGIATPLVISVHSIVSLDFATSVLPGWHSSLFPPYFVAGAISSGLAMVLTIVIPLRAWLGLHAVITTDHLERLAMLMLAVAMIVTYSYACEHWCALVVGDGPERRVLFVDRPFGRHAPLWWATLVGNVLLPLVLWSKRARRSPAMLMVVALGIDVAMWTERLMLIVTSQERDFLPGSFGGFLPSPIDMAIFAGTLGFFALLLLLTLRAVPFVPIADLKEDRRHEAAEAARARAVLEARHA